MGLEFLKRQFKKRRMTARKGKVELLRMRGKHGASKKATGRPCNKRAPACAAGSEEREILEMAAELEEMLDRDCAGSSAKKLDPLDRMRNLWRRMRKLLPQLPVLKGPELRKGELTESFSLALGIGWAPLPEWGCPEGIDSYMGRLTRYVRDISAARGVRAGDLPLPISTGGWDEGLLFEVLLPDSPPGTGAIGGGAFGAP